MEFVIVWVAELKSPANRLFLSFDRKVTQDWVEKNVRSEFKKSTVVNPRKAIRVSDDEVVFVPTVPLGETFEGCQERDMVAYLATLAAERANPKEL